MRRISSITVALTALSLTTVGLAGAQGSSLKLADKLVSKAQQLNSSIRATNLQVKKTLESYNYIIQGKAQDPRAEYKKLVKDLDKSVKARENVRFSAEEMDKAATKYFESWEASQSGYNDPDMKAKSEERLAKTRESYARIFEVGGKAGEDFDTFIAKMDDQIRFLGQDLNPTAIADLTDEAAALNEQADTLFKSISETLKTSTDYTTALKPQ